MTDDEIQIALNAFCERIRDPRKITEARLDLIGEINRFLLGDKRVKRADIIKAIKREKQPW